ncbi:MAG: hypothetical protein HKN73_03960 [Gemmatimonadetes bacterium]|nr:hypothetical protein [Gemmatimonadota bacterium]
MGRGRSDHRSTRVMGMAALALVGCLGGQEVQGQAEPLSVAEVREQFEQMARPGGYWATSNAEYATPESGEPDEYRMAFALTPDGHSISGCMWGSPAPENASPFWFFFHAWDPTTHSVLAYQSSPSGAVAIGREVRGADGGMESIQTLKFPGGEEQRVRHLNRQVHPDTLASRSFNGSSTSDAAWEPRRSYTWIWRASPEVNPC